VSLASFFAQLLNGLAGASSLFLVAAGLTLIFGVTRVVNFAHGSLYMLGAYLTWTLVEMLGSGPLGFWGAVVLAALIVAAIGALIERLLLQRIYAAPELLQLAATFGVVLIVRDAVLAAWGPEDLLGPRAAGFTGAVDIFDRAVPSYDLLLLALGPLVLAALWTLMRRTRFGIVVRAEAFVVTVVGGLGSIPGAFVAALIIGLTRAFCIALGTVDVAGVAVAFPKLTLVAEFVVMAIVLAVKPHGLLGTPAAPPPTTPIAEFRELVTPPGRRALIGAAVALALAALLPLAGDDYTLVLAADVLVFALFAASLQLLMGTAGLASFGHAAYFGLGAYAAAIAIKHGAPMGAALALAPLGALAGAIIFGWFCVRLSGVYLAMLTLAFAQILWSIAFQWDSVTGGSNGVVGVWPAAWLAGRRAYYWFTLLVCCAGLAAIAWLAHAPFGYALRAGRDSPLRAEALGIDVRNIQWAAFALAGAFAGLAGGLFAFSKGSISPETLAIPRSVDALVMVLLGGLNALAGPLIGAAAFTWLADALARVTEYWHAVLGVAILVIVIVFPMGIGGAAKRLLAGRLR
jgi:branched-chain amino acid transport system permease protein